MRDRDTRHDGKTEGAFPSGATFLERERVETERRWRTMAREVMQILRHVPDIRLSKLEELPPQVGVDEKQRLSRLLFEALMEGDQRPGLKRSVVRRMADKMGRYLLWNRISSTPAIHEIEALIPWWISQVPGSAMERLRDVGLAYVLNGSVLPIQTVWRELLEAREVYVGHCVCRSSGIAADVPAGERVRVLSTPEESELLLGRLVERYRALEKRGELDGTDPGYRELFEEMISLARFRPAAYGLQLLLDETYPEWELLPVHEKYTPNWIRSMYHNRKARPLHKELALELANVFFFSRRVLFTSMRVFDSPYTICSCPTPEHGGGCVLTNWYYFGHSNASLLPNEEPPGRRVDARGFVQPCRYFEVRARRECLGCGCMHGADNPRDLRLFLQEADRMLTRHGGEGGLGGEPGRDVAG